MYFMGDYAEFGRPRGSRDKQKRRPRGSLGGAAAALGGGAIVGAGSAAAVREKAYRSYANPVIRQATREYRASKGKKLSRKARRELNRSVRQSFDNLAKNKSQWNSVGEVFDYDVARRRVRPGPKFPWEYAKGRPIIINNAPVKRSAAKLLKQAVVARPLRTGSVGGLAVGALGYGLYRATRRRD